MTSVVYMMFLASISYSFFNGWTWRSLEKGDGIESENGRGPVNVPMIGHGSVGMTDGTTIGTEIETEKGTERGNGCGREREREHGRDRGHGRDKERECGRDNDCERDSRPERDQVHERGYDQAGYERDHGCSHDKEAGYGSESKHGRGRSGTRGRDIEHGEHGYVQEWYGEPRKQGHDHDYNQYDESQYQEHYDHHQPHGFADSQHDSEESNTRLIITIVHPMIRLSLITIKVSMDMRILNHVKRVGQ